MQALENIRVLDFSQAMAGPTCSMLLADFGADVIKVEPPVGGETSRNWGSARFGENGQMSGLYAALNRNKSGLAIDLKSPEGKAAIAELLPTVDIVLENFRPGVADRLGIGYEELRAKKPDLVYCSISGFGQDGPLRDRPGLDMLLQAYAGHMSITGEPGRPSVRTGTSPIDLLTGAHAAFGILAALRHRDRSGEGQHVDLSLYDTAIHLISHYIADYTGGGEPAAKHGAYFGFLAPYGMFEARDREFYFGPDGRSFTSFCKEIGREDILQNPLYVTNVDRLKNRDSLHEILFPIFRERDAADWVAVCQKLGIPTSLTETIPEVIEQAQAKAREMIIPAGAENVFSAGIPIKMTRTPGQVRRTAPQLGEDNVRLLGRAKHEQSA